MRTIPKPQESASDSAIALHKRAEDNLQYIRASMESATLFTAVSGKGYVVTGTSAMFAAWLAEQQTSQNLWLLVWMIELVVAASLLVFMTARKAIQQGGSIWSSSGKKLLLAFTPTMVVGGVMTLSFFLQGNVYGLPGIWLGLYGAAVMTAGAHSVTVIPVMGALFILLGSVVLLTNIPTGLALGIGMGGLHLVFGVIIWRNHGG